MTTGTTPAGVDGEQQVSRWVRRMFDAVAPRYDLLNHLLSLNIDRYWRSRTARRLEAILCRPDARVVDLCCGSGDLLLAMQRRSNATLWGSDFSHPMLVLARQKIGRTRQPSQVFESDALHLPLRDASLDLVTAAFGFRNFANYRRGLAELHRVLKAGGTAAILEFSTPPNRAFRALYGFYSGWVLPRLGGLLSGSPDAYRYLPESVRNFPGAELLADEMRQAGFCDVSFERMTFGIVALHLGRKETGR